ncbi:peroxiredoxin [Sciscionella sediminilitoris]|uniref:peroxiredoxin n=1 Tax=Sciscionella sediminilitoris TaxID=1445613 RepID=UPI0004DF391D|nr:peroxiredoxin [Sciscionella sp. SE31]
MAIEVGAKAPDFTLNDYNRQPVSLADYRGRKNVLVVFYPFAFSGICTGELCGVRDSIDTFSNDKVEIIGISVDTTFSLKVWSAQEGYTFPLLSDFWPHGEVAKAFGVFNEAAGMANRGTFLIDTEGVVRFAEVNEPGEARDQEAWKKAIAAL